jgi:hypothetical protein
MRLHTDTLTADDIRAALTTEKEGGRIARTVHFDTLTEHRSTTHARAFEVKLGSFEKAPGDGRRWGNSGGYGATSRTTGDYTATHDEWGFFLASLYASDPAIVVGGASHPIYRDAADFDTQTGATYRLSLADVIERDGDPYPYRSGRDLVGRRGAGRSDGDSLNGRPVPAYAIRSGGWLTLAPRTADWARAFAAGQVR